MSPLEFMQRLAALVPRRRLHLIRFHEEAPMATPEFCAAFIAIAK
jgi:Putative transposase